MCRLSTRPRRALLALLRTTCAILFLVAAANAWAVRWYCFVLLNTAVFDDVDIQLTITQAHGYQQTNTIQLSPGEHEEQLLSLYSNSLKLTVLVSTLLGGNGWYEPVTGVLPALHRVNKKTCPSGWEFQVLRVNHAVTPHALRWTTPTPGYCADEDAVDDMCELGHK